MRMPLLPMPFHPSATPTSRPRARGLLLGLVAGVTCLGVGNLSAQTSDAELAQLKAQMQQMQDDYAKRLGEMEAKMKSMEAQVALSAGIAQSRAMTGPDGKEIDLKGGPVVIPGSRHVYAQFQVVCLRRAPALALLAMGSARRSISKSRTQASATGAFVWATKTTSILRRVRFWTHMLGDDPDVMDVRFQITFKFNNERRQRRLLRALVKRRN